MENLQEFNFPLINCHTHTAMIAFRGLYEDKSLEDWLTNYIWPAEMKTINPQMVKENTKKGIKEMKKNKIAYFVDMYFYEEQVAQAAIEENMPVLIGEGLLDNVPIRNKNFDQLLEITKELIQKYKNHPLVSVSVAPHSIYTVSEKNLLKAKELARKYNVLYQIHCSETKKEFDDCLKKYGLTPVQYLDRLGILDQNTLLFHCVWLDEKDIEILAKKGPAVVHCPLSNAKLGCGVAPVAKLLKNNVLVCLGTDGPASSNRLDIWEAGKYAALFQKAINYDASLVSTKEVLKMMTVNGMRACHLQEIWGKTLEEWEKEIEQTDFSYLYHLNFC